MIHKIENQEKGPYKKVHEGIDLDNGGDNIKLHGAEKDVRAITLGSPIVIIKEHDFKFDIYEIKIRGNNTSLATLQTLVLL